MKNFPDKIVLKRDIEHTFIKLFDELEGVTAANFNELPFEGSWTIGQTLTHIIMSSSGIPDVTTSLAKRPYDEKVTLLRDLFLNFDLKFTADPSITPGLPPHDKNTLLRELTKIMQQLKTIAATKKLEMLCKDMEFPTLGFLTRYEWLRFILVHIQRHTYQVSEIKKYLKS